MMKRGVLLAVVAALFVGCGPQTYSPYLGVILNTSGSTLANSGTGTVYLSFTALGTPTTVYAFSQNATSSTVYTATNNCGNAAAVAGSTTATTSVGSTGTFTVTAIAIGPQCTISISSSTSSPGGSIVVLTNNVPTAPATNVPITGKQRSAGS